MAFLLGPRQCPTYFAETEPHSHLQGLWLRGFTRAVLRLYGQRESTLVQTLCLPLVSIALAARYHNQSATHEALREMSSGPALHQHY